MLRVLKGNLFNSDRQTLVNTVNCKGVMGAGIALEFRLRHPDMFRQYVDHCATGRMDVGKLWLYRPTNGKERRWVLNFPTKRDWKHRLRRNICIKDWNVSSTPTGVAELYRSHSLCLGH